jgi:hypothetical protein
MWISSCVKLDNQRLVNREWHIGSRRPRYHASGKRIVRIMREVARQSQQRTLLDYGAQRFILACLTSQSDYLARIDLITRPIHAPVAHSDVTVRYELPRRRNGAREAKPEDDVVEATLK